MTRKVTDDRSTDFLRQLKLVGGIVAFVLLGIAIYFERRFDAFEAVLEYNSPTNLEPGDLIERELHHWAVRPVEGQVVYVPAYSHIYHSDDDPYLLTITLSIRNTSTEKEIVVKSVRYFDTQGREVRSYLDKPVKLPALGTTEVVVGKNDSSGGSGANFLVEWYAATPVTEPIIEAVMIDTASQQGISFVRRGSPISEVVPTAPDSQMER